MIIECENLEQFKTLGNKLVEKEKYALYLTSDGMAVLRPTVTTRGRDTILIRGLSAEEQKEIENWWGFAFRVKSVFREDMLI
ncbi:MAG: hypothetical protein QXG39_00040 [Candidatus Aenigmatarchaeota archaeon]